MNYISIRQILDDLLADDMMKGLSLERAIKYTVEFIKVVGMPKLFKDKVELVEIFNHRGVLPCDFYEIIQVKDPKGFAYLSAEGSFGNIDRGEFPAFTYKIQDNVIITSTKDIPVEVAYRAMLVDGEGFPLVPDNGIFPRALELYIQKRYFTILFNSGKVNKDVLQNVQQEYAFCVGQAQADLVRPSLDEMQSITNMWNTLIPKVHKHADAFASVNAPEIRSF